MDLSIQRETSNVNLILQEKDIEPCRRTKRFFTFSFIPVRFLLILVCYVAHTAKYLTHLLTLRYVLKLDNLHTTQRAKIIAGFMANVGNVFIERFQTF